MAARRFAPNVAALYGAAAAGGSAIDPETLAPLFAWDPSRTTLFKDHGGSVPAAVGDQILFVTDRGSAGVAMVDDTSRAGVLLKQDAGNGNRKYFEFTAATPTRMVTAPVTRALPITRIRLLRWRTLIVDKYVTLSRGDYKLALSARSGTQIGQYNGTAHGNLTTVSANVWYVIVEIFNTTSQLGVDNAARSSASVGTLALSAEGIAWGSGPDTDLVRYPDIDLGADYWWAGTLSDANIAGVTTFLGAYVGKTL